jgi:hypothetical protein
MSEQCCPSHSLPPVCISRSHVVGEDLESYGYTVQNPELPAEKTTKASRANMPSPSN